MEVTDVPNPPTPQGARVTPRRRLFALSAGVSVVMLLCVGGLWVRSFWVADYVSYTMTPGGAGVVQVGVDSVLRSVHLGYVKTPGSLPPGEVGGFRVESVPAGRVRSVGGWWGFGVAGKTGVGFAHREVWFPHLLAVVVFALLPVRWLVTELRLRHRVSKGLCLRCGYDLRGGGSGRCPECGA